MKVDKADDGLTVRHVVFHSLSDAKAALEAGKPMSTSVSLCTARGAVRYAGPYYLIDVVRLAIVETGSRSDIETSALIDCRDEPALVFAALRAGWQGIVYNGARSYRNEVEAAVAAHRATLLTRPPRALDLLDVPDPIAACRKWYAR